MDTLKLISINIEMDRHLDLIQSFLKKEKPDVVCLQEVLKSDFPKLGEKFGMTGVFANMGKYCLEPEKGCLDSLGYRVISISKLHVSEAEALEDGIKHYYGIIKDVEKEISKLNKRKVSK